MYEIGIEMLAKLHSNPATWRKLHTWSATLCLSYVVSNYSDPCCKLDLCFLVKIYYHICVEIMRKQVRRYLAQIYLNIRHNKWSNPKRKCLKKIYLLLQYRLREISWWVFSFSWTRNPELLLNALDLRYPHQKNP